MKDQKTQQIRADEDLINNFLQTRNAGAFEPLVQRHMPKVRRVILRIVLNNEDCDDLVQETFIRAYEKIGTFQGESQFSTWLCQIGVNMSISYLRKKKKTVSTDNIPLENLTSLISTPKTDINDDMERVHKAIARLSKKLRAVIVLNVIEEMDLKEIAVVLKCPIATVYWRLHQARKKLARELEVKNERVR